MVPIVGSHARLRTEQSAFRDEIVRQIFGDVGKIEDGRQQRLPMATCYG